MDEPRTIYHRAGPPGKQTNLLHKYLRFARVMSVPRKNGGIMSGPPLTLVVAEKWFDDHRLIYFVDLRSRLWIDGWHWSRLRRRYRDASVVDAQTFTAFHADYRRPKLSRSDRRTFRKWRNHYRAEWIKKLKSQSNFELWPANLWERFIERFTTPRIPRHIQLMSEERIKWFDGTIDCYGAQFPPCRYAYATETTVLVDHPTLYPDTFHDTRELLGYAVISAHMQADVKRFAVRCWWINHAGDRKFYDGYDPPVNTKGLVSLRHVRPGLDSVPFDPMDLRDATDRQHAMSGLSDRKEKWLARNATKSAETN